MNDGATWGDELGFHKRHPSAKAARAALQRSAAARLAHVRTPAARSGSEPVELIFDRIESDGAPPLADMLAALHPLHRMKHRGLMRFDPFARILPRLTDAPPAILARVADLLAQDRALNWPINHVIHGDFHPGQVLRDRQGRVWLIDLDDLALGPVEADLGNLAAWMATQAPGAMAELSAQAQALVMAATAVSNQTLLAHFHDIALIRRALKLRERGEDWALRQLLP